MKIHYFAQEEADDDDSLLKMCKEQGYVPFTCLLGGATVWAEVKDGRCPCNGCNCDREKCNGVPKRSAHDRQAATELEKLAARIAGLR